MAIWQIWCVESLFTTQSYNNFTNLHTLLAVNHIGPQVRFPIPEGILNYNGENFLSLSLWGQEDGPVKLDGLQLEVDAIIKSGYQKPRFVDGERYVARNNSY